MRMPDTAHGLECQADLCARRASPYLDMYVDKA